MELMLRNGLKVSSAAERKCRNFKLTMTDEEVMEEVETHMKMESTSQMSPVTLNI